MERVIALIISIINDKKYVETEVMQSNNLFVPIDLTNAPKKIDGVF